MALRDPRNKSRNNASRRTTSATRSKRAASTAKYNPKPTSASQRSGKTNTGSLKITQGKGGEVKSPRLKQALDGVKTKRTPAKTPPKTSVKTNPPSSTPRGAQGPRTAPSQGPSQRVNNRGLQGSRPAPKTGTKPPPSPKGVKPSAGNVGSQIRQARAVQQANPGRAARAARKGITPAKVAGVVAGGLKSGGRALGVGIARKILASSGTPGAAKMSRLGIGGNAPVSKPKPKPQPKVTGPKGPGGARQDKTPIKAPPKKDSTVLAKQKGKEGVMRNSVFYPTGWSQAQRQRYAVQKLKK
jgi:hypothetical protein